MIKQDIVDWLIANESLVLFFEKTVNSYAFICADDPFSEEVKNQRNELIKELMLNEASKTIGLTIEFFYDTISKGEFDKYIEEVLRNGL